MIRIDLLPGRWWVRAPRPAINGDAGVCLRCGYRHPIGCLWLGCGDLAANLARARGDR